MTEKLSDISPYLYHYTNEQGLYGILNEQKEQCLWATHYKFLNDKSEIEIAREKLKGYLSSHMLNFLNQLNTETNHLQYIQKNNELDDIAKNNSEQFVDSEFHNMFPTDEIYVTSFCTAIESKDNFINNNGLLSQWRAYGGDGGYAFMFKTSALLELIKLEHEYFQYLGIILADVIYSDDENNEELSGYVQRISNLQNEMFKYHSRQIINMPDSSTLTYAFQAFAGFMTCFKHRGFKEEQEVRIIALPSGLNEADQIPGNKSDKERKFRNKNGIQVPYIELFGSLGKKLPIEKIIVGSHKDKELRADSLRIMLRNTAIKVTTSEIPYVT